MIQRRQVNGTAVPKDQGGIYFSQPSSGYKFIGSGSTVLDLALGGGYPLGRMTNIIGDNSSGKTLLAIEEMANFAKQYPKGKIWYRETEAAFDQSYAEALGLPLTRVDFGDKGQWNTVEDIFEDLTRCAKQAKAKGTPGLYIVDSWDALSDRAELERDKDTMDNPGYQLTKQKRISQMFRQRVRDVETADIHFNIISQTRARIGIGFGDKTTRSGGAALDFYASQHLKLAKMGQIKRTVKGVNHVIGVKIRARCIKNKIGLPHREADFEMYFGFGINDAASCLEYLLSIGRTAACDNLTKEKAKALLGFLQKLDRSAYEEWHDELRKSVKRVWSEVQTEGLPTWRKYGDV